MDALRACIEWRGGCGGLGGVRAASRQGWRAAHAALPGILSIIVIIRITLEHFCHVLELAIAGWDHSCGRAPRRSTQQRAGTSSTVTGIPFVPALVSARKHIHAQERSHARKYARARMHAHTQPS